MYVLAYVLLDFQARGTLSRGLKRPQEGLNMASTPPDFIVLGRESVLRPASAQRVLHTNATAGVCVCVFRYSSGICFATLAGLRHPFERARAASGGPQRASTPPEVIVFGRHSVMRLGSTQSAAA